MNEVFANRIFRNHSHKGLLNIIYTGGWLSEKMKLIYEKEDVTIHQMNLLQIVNASEKPLTTLQIRDQMLERMSDTSRMIDRLVAKNLVYKESNQGDKRKVNIFLTAKGKELVNNITVYEKELDNLLCELDDDEQKQLNHLLDKIRCEV